MYQRASGLGSKESRKVGRCERWGANIEGLQESGSSMGTPRQRKGLKATMPLLVQARTSLERAHPEAHPHRAWGNLWALQPPCRSVI